jgi:hypothetical protein
MESPTETIFKEKEKRVEAVSRKRLNEAKLINICQFLSLHNYKLKRDHVASSQGQFGDEHSQLSYLHRARFCGVKALHNPLQIFLG